MSDTPAPSGTPAPLSGFTVAVTAARRADEICGLLQRRGATVMHAPALRIVPLADDTDLHKATVELASSPPDTVVATTGIGFRSWMEAAEGWGVGEQLRTALASATLLARGPKATGAIRAAGLREAWSPRSESSGEVLQRLLSEGPLHGRRIAVQLHGEPLRDFTDALRNAGAVVVPVPVYRWMAPLDLGPLDRLLDAVAAGTVDAITFTSALAATGLLRRANELNCQATLLTALGASGACGVSGAPGSFGTSGVAGAAGALDAASAPGVSGASGAVSALGAAGASGAAGFAAGGAGAARVVACCVGPVTAGPLLEAGVPATWPERYRVGALIRHVTQVLESVSRVLPVAGHELEVRGSAALVDGELRPVPPGPMAVLRALARNPGWVVPRSDLLAELPGGGADEHAVEAAVARLRSGLGAPGLVQTVVKRGYRLAPA